MCSLPGQDNGSLVRSMIPRTALPMACRTPPERKEVLTMPGRTATIAVVIIARCNWSSPVVLSAYRLRETLDYQEIQFILSECAAAPMFAALRDFVAQARKRIPREWAATQRRLLRMACGFA